MAHVPSATRETLSCVPGISTNSVSTAGSRIWIVGDMEVNPLDWTDLSGLIFIRSQSIGRAACTRRRRRTVTQGPYVGRHRRHLIGAELSAAHGWHGGAILFRLRHAGADYFLNRCVTAITPKPMCAGEIWTQCSAGRVRAVATRAGRTADLTVVNAITKCDHLLRRACRNGKARG